MTGARDREGTIETLSTQEHGPFIPAQAHQEGLRYEIRYLDEPGPPLARRAGRSVLDPQVPPLRPTRVPCRPSAPGRFVHDPARTRAMTRTDPAHLAEQLLAGDR